MSIMLDEIRQQPEVLDRTLREQIPAIEELKRRLAERRPRMIVLAARGTSDNAALLGRYLLEISTGQLLILYLLAYAMGAPIALDHLRQIPAWADAALKLENDIGIRASRYRFMERTVVVGRGLNYANAFEFALKLMETCYIVAERFSSADFLHGPIAMVESSFPVFLFTPGGVTWSSMQTILDKVGEAKAEMLLITDRSNPDALNLGLRTVCVPARLSVEGPLPEEVFTPIPYIIPAQLFAAALAKEKGLNPDQPRGLSKVTLTL